MIALDIKTFAQKKTDPVDLLKPLLKFLSTHQEGLTKPKEHQESLNLIQQHRNELRNLQDRSEGSKDLCIKYAAEVEHLAAHFPINSGSNRIHLTFTWYNSFVRNERVSQGNCFYDQACALFNAAVIEHQLGASQNRQTEEGINSAIKHFQTAAGIFQYIKDNVLPKIVEKITSDITAECLEFLCNLCLANAQQCVVEKAHKKGFKPVGIAQLAYETESQYASIQSQLNSGTLKPLFGKVWEDYFSFTKLYFSAFTIYQMSLADREEDEVGNEIARLEQALSIIKKAQQFKVSDNLKGSLNNFEITCIKAYNIAQNENEKVYHYKVPKFESLPEVQRRSMAKIIPIDNLVKYAGVPDMFADLFPVQVIEATKKYMEQVRNKEQTAFKTAREHRDALNSKLASMGLPGSIMATSSNEGFPEEIHAKIQAINKQGGLVKLEQEREVLKEMASVARELCDTIKHILEKEAADDQACREKYGNEWKRLPSATLTQGMYKSLNDYYSKVNAASNADRIIDDKISKWKSGFTDFEKTPTELNAILPSPHNNPAIQQVATDLKKFYELLDSLFTKEQEIENEIVEKYNNTVKIQELLLKEQSRLDNAVQEKVDELEKDLTRLTSLATEEDNVMTQIVKANTVFTQTKSQNNQNKQREDIIQGVYASINRYNEIMSNIKEGKNFYQTMQDILEKLKQKAEDFSFARETNKQDIIDSFKNMPAAASYMLPQQQYAPPYQQNPPPYQYGNAPPQYNQPPEYRQQQQPYYNPQQQHQSQQQQRYYNSNNRY
jgi:programmed cell death 6-interacting protein